MIRISLLCLLLLSACSSKQSSNQDTLSIRTTQVTAITTESKKEYPIITQPFRVSELSFRVSGPIDRLEVYAGNYYRKGDIIAEIDNRDYRIRKERAQAVYQQTKAEHERIHSLYEKNSISASTYEKAKAEYVSAKTALEVATNELNDTKLIAPFSGYIGDVYVERFQDVKTSQPVVTLIDIDQLKIEAYVTQEIAFHLQKNQVTSLTLDIQPEQTRQTTIIEVSKGTTSNNLSYLVTALLPNKDKELLAGLSGKIYFESAEKKTLSSALCIPQTALYHRPTEGDYVWIVDVSNATVSQRKVAVQELLPHGNVAIASGLHPQEIIATSGLRFLSEGAHVQIADIH